MNAVPDLTTTTFKMVGSLLVVLAILWLMYRFLRHLSPAAQAAGGGGMIKMLASHYLGVKKSITMVQVPGSILVLGLSNDRITLLSRIEDPELIAQIRQDAGTRTPFSFRQHLQRFAGTTRAGSGPGTGGSEAHHP